MNNKYFQITLYGNVEREYEEGGETPNSRNEITEKSQRGEQRGNVRNGKRNGVKSAENLRKYKTLKWFGYG